VTASDGSTWSTAAALVGAVRAAVGVGRAAPQLAVDGETALGGPLPVPGLAVGSVAAQLLAARDLTGSSGRLTVDARHVGVAFRSERFARLDGQAVAMGFAPLSRFWRTADGWLRLHGNYPHHRAAALAVLGEDVGAAAVRWRAEDLESAVVAAGGAAAAVRTAAEWRDHPQGRAVSGLPLMGVERVAHGAGRTVELEGLRVLDLTRVIAGPVATRALASHGADVLRIDAPHLPDDRGTLIDTGAGKRHVVLDLADPADRRTVEELLVQADVVVQGYRPGALEAYGMGPGELAERHPHLVTVRLSAWGSAGPWAHRRGFDSLVQAATGIADLYGAPEGPGVLPAQALDHATGQLAAALVMGALARQRAEGGGWYGELSLARTAHWLLDAPTGPREPVVDVDPAPYLLDLATPAGTATVVAPPGSPPWTRAAVLPPAADPVWCARVAG
jgi:hypothetical protein